VIVRRARPSERDAVEQLLGAQLAEHEVALGREALRSAVQGALDDPRRGFFLLALLDGRDVGVAYVSLMWSLEHGGLSCWLEELYVRPAHREGGIGTRMLAVVLEEARAAGCAAVDLEVQADHARAARLYERAGFTPHARRRWVLRLDQPKA
jgi:GNAT superfamily N-acetyltransferase